MPRRIIEVDGEPWEVAVSGRITQYTKDEFGLVFTRGTGPEPGAARRALLAARRQEPRAVAGPAERPGAAGPAGPLAAGLDRARDGVPPLTSDRRAAAAGRSTSTSTRPRPTGSLPPEAVVGARGRGRPRAPWRSPITIPLAGVPAAVAAGERARASGWWADASSAAAAPWGEMHVLGYFLPSESPELEAFLERCRADRVRRGREMVTRLQRLGRRARLRRRAAPAERRRGRAARTWRGPSCARAAPRHVSEAFDRYIGRGRPAFVEKVLPQFREIADLVHAVRGLVSVAHLKERGTRSFLERLKREGLDAVETRHPSHDAELRARLTDIALRLGLLRTGGSDWHGDPEPGATHGALGSQEVPLEWLERLEQVPRRPARRPPSDERADRAGHAGARLHGAARRTGAPTSSRELLRESRVLLVFYPGNNTPG